jgi:branched-chain amino acid transport system substrate-binding protein
MYVPDKKIVRLFASVIFGSIILGMLTHLMFKPGSPEEYRNLTAIEKYAGSIPEFPESDDRDWEDPHFLEFYKTRHPSIFGSALQALGLWQRPPWSVAFMAELMKAQTKLHHARGLVDGEKTFIHIRADKATKIVVFGDIHGSFHSLIRDLKYLRDNGSMTDDLKISSANLFLIFNGDFIDRASYSVDCMILVNLLMKQNPEQVIYVAGTHERRGAWKDYSFRRELVSRGKYFSTQAIPFDDQIMAFFATLPAAVYLSGGKDSKEVVRISFFSRDKLSYDESLLNPSFLQQSSLVKIHHVGEQKPSEMKLDIRASIETQEWRRSDRIKSGLGQLDQDRGATTWAVLSSPTFINKFYLDFHEDAFAVIEIDQYVRDASITSTHQDLRKLQSFITDPPVNLLSGRHAGNKAPTADIKVGATMSLVRGMPVTGRQLKSGLSARINEFNRGSQTFERNVRLYVDNDDYMPKLARQNTREHLDLGIRSFLLSLGSVSSYLDLISEKKAVVFFPQNGSSLLRSANYPNLVHFRASYEDEVRALIRVTRQEYSASKFAFFYQDDAYGQGAFKAAVEELKKQGIHDFLALPYTRGTVNFATQVKEIEKYSPNALGLFSVATATKEFIRQIGVTQLFSMNLFALSAVGEVQLKRFIKHKGLLVLYGSAVPNPFISEQPIAKAYRNAMHQDKNILDVSSFEAYIGASLFLHGLNQLSSKDPNPLEILRVIEGMKQVDFQGINLDFNAATRSLATEVYIETDEKSIWQKYPVG